MLNIHKETIEDGTVVLNLEGAATVEHAEQLHQALLEGLRDAEQLRINCEQVTSFDLYGLQLLGSARRSSTAWEKTLSFQGRLPTAFEESKQALGFTRQHACSVCPENQGCLWTGHSNPSN